MTTQNVDVRRLMLCLEYQIEIRPPSAVHSSVRDAIDSMIDRLQQGWDQVRGDRPFHPHSLNLRIEDAGLTRVRICGELSAPEETP